MSSLADTQNGRLSYGCPRPWWCWWWSWSHHVEQKARNELFNTNSLLQIIHIKDHYWYFNKAKFLCKPISCIFWLYIYFFRQNSSSGFASTAFEVNGIRNIILYFRTLPTPSINILTEFHRSYVKMFFPVICTL